MALRTRTPGARALLPATRCRASGQLGALLSSPVLGVRLMTALQVLQGSQTRGTCKAAWRRAEVHGLQRRPLCRRLQVRKCRDTKGEYGSRTYVAGRLRAAAFDLLSALGTRALPTWTAVGGLQTRHALASSPRRLSAVWSDLSAVSTTDQVGVSHGWRVYLYVLLEISPNLPSNQP